MAMGSLTRNMMGQQEVAGCKPLPPVFVAGREETILRHRLEKGNYTNCRQKLRFLCLEWRFFVASFGVGGFLFLGVCHLVHLWLHLLLANHVLCWPENMPL